MKSGSADFADLVSGGNVARIKMRIEQKYGFTPTDEYCTDLISFVNEMTGEESDESDTSGDDDQGEANLGQRVN